MTIPGARRFFFGNIIDLITREKMSETKQVPVHGVWLQDYILAPSQGDEHFQPHKYPVFLCNFLSEVGVFVSDPEVIAELYTTKQFAWDKNDYMGELTKQFMGRSFIFAKGDEEWRIKRKACAHAFYKERLE